ncbi:hypothetical protein ABUT79_03720, partial [Escherichia coli]
MRYLLIVIIFIIGFSALPVWAMDCYAEHEGGNTVVIGYVPRISIPSNGKKGDKIWQSSEYFMNVFCNNALPAPSPGEEYPSAWTKEGANKQVISSQADSLIKISRIWADFFPANTSN